MHRCFKTSQTHSCKAGDSPLIQIRFRSRTYFGPLARMDVSTRRSMRVAGGILIALALVSAEMVKARTPRAEVDRHPTRTREAGQDSRREGLLLLADRDLDGDV